MAREQYIEKIKERLNELTKDELKDVSILTAAQLGVRQKLAEKESIENEIVNLKTLLEKQQPQIPEPWASMSRDEILGGIGQYVI